MNTPASVQVTRALVLTLSAGLAGWVIWRAHESAQPPVTTQIPAEAGSSATPETPATRSEEDPFYLYSSKSAAPSQDLPKPLVDPAQLDPTYLFSSKSAVPSAATGRAQPGQTPESDPSFLFSSKSAAPPLEPEPTFLPSSKVATPPGGFLTPPPKPKDIEPEQAPHKKP